MPMNYFGHLTDDHFSPSPTATQNCTCAIGEENEDSMSILHDPGELLVDSPEIQVIFLFYFFNFVH